jgi:hypothetical protein
MAFIRKIINIVSPMDGKRYDSLFKYEKSLDKAGCHIMTDTDFKRMKEKVEDEARSKPKKKEDHNHVHIDLNNDRIIKSKRDDI